MRRWHSCVRWNGKYCDGISRGLLTFKARWFVHSPPVSDERNPDFAHTVCVRVRVRACACACVWFVMILTINIHYSPLSIINWLVFVIETLCAFCNVGAEFLNMVQTRGGQICHKARKHHKILGARKLILTLRWLMSYIYIYGAPILDVSRSHTTTQHSR